MLTADNRILYFRLFSPVTMTQWVVVTGFLLGDNGLKSPSHLVNDLSIKSNFHNNHMLRLH